MNKLYCVKYLAIVFLLLIEFGSFAQERKGFTINGKISSETGREDGAKVDVFRNKIKINSIDVAANGRFSIFFDFNYEYTLILKLEDCFPKKIVISTVVPLDILKSDPVFPPYNFEQILFTEIKGIERSFSENTILRVIYDENVDNFIPETYYNDAQIKKQIETAIWQSQQISKTSDEIDKLSAEEYKLLRKEYEQWLKEAGDAFNGGQYQQALNGYKAANRLLPNEQFPLDRMAEINDLLLALQFKEELDKASIEKFNRLIAEADNHFDKKEYAPARNSYSEALNIKQSDEHSLTRIHEIDLIFTGQKDNLNFQLLVDKGNDLFNQNLYDEAKNVFNEALDLKPKEQYPKDKIKEIDDIFAGQAKQEVHSERYKKALSDGDNARNRNQFLRAKEHYNFALSFIPGDPVALDRIASVEEIINRQERDKEFNSIISRADKSFKKKVYDNALKDYQDALKIKPGEKYAINQVNTINRLLNSKNQQAELEQQYAAKITEADQLFNEKNYESSKTAYQAALGLKPGESYPISQIKEITKQIAALNSQKQLNDRYNSLIVSADNYFNSQNYSTAKKDYSSASKLKSSETYPKQRISEIDRLLTQMAAAQKSYSSAISSADRFFGKKQYNEARNAYTEAKQAKSDETYPDEMISKIDDLLANQARLAAQAKADEEARLLASEKQQDVAYNSMIKEADRLFDRKEYVAAIGKYRSALDFKPQEQYPIQRIEEIRGWIQKIAETDKTYNEAVEKADKLFNQKQFSEAKLAYSEALSAKPEESYPVEMIAKIDSTENANLIAQQKAAADEEARLKALEQQKENSYNEAITKADGFFQAQNYPNATSEYKSALDIKPEEVYPQQKITEIEGILSQLAAAQNAYDEAISRADKHFKKELYIEARSAYNEAKVAKADEVYPDEMLAKIDAAEQAIALAAADEEARLKALEQQKENSYNEAITKADGFFQAKNYPNATSEYKSALDIKPEEVYPQQKITEIEGILSQLAAAQNAYDEAISRADKHYKKELYIEARSAYNEAKVAKADEVYPDEMLAKIDAAEQAIALAAADEEARLKALEQQKENSYNEAITKADGFFQAQNYTNATSEYKSALDIKPDEVYPQQKITEIEGILSQLAAAQNAYDEAISRADKHFKKELYIEARSAYNEAKVAKAEEVYPDEMLAKIDAAEQAIALQKAQTEAEKLAAEQARLKKLADEQNKLYTQEIQNADSFFNSADYSKATKGYNSALKIKPNEGYPKQKIDEIKNILEQILLTDNLYTEQIKQADKDFKTAKYEAAREGYGKALDIKPNESYPSDQLLKINSLLSEMYTLKELENNYTAAIEEADRFFNVEDYQNSITAYQKALSFKPKEKYPKIQIGLAEERLDYIARQLREKEAIQLAYQVAIKKADEAFSAGIYDDAIPNYQEAITIIPYEQYPKDQLLKIDELKAAAIKSEFDRVIAEADNYFNGQNYVPAKERYQTALNFIPDETYPIGRINEIDKILSDLALAEKTKKENDRLYEQAILKADKDFEMVLFQSAISFYNEAHIIKPNENYPVQKIQEINQIVEKNRIDEEYRKVLLAADAYYRMKSYVEAKPEYSKALTIKPDEEYPANQIKKIDDLLKQMEEARIAAEQLAAQSQTAVTPTITEPAIESDVYIEGEMLDMYNEFIQLADGSFSSEAYNVSRYYYFKALEIKPGEVYPERKIDDIRKILNARLADRREREYQEAVDKGDEELKKGELAVARFYFNKAKGFKPAQKYPQLRLDEIQTKINSALNKQSQAEYQTIINQADTAFNGNQFSIARFYYLKAANLLPAEQYPKQQLKIITEKLNQK